MMLPVGVHMLSLAGKHLFVQICFMFYFSFFDLLLFVSGELGTIQRERKAAKCTVSTRCSYGKLALTVTSPSSVHYLVDCSPANLTIVCRKFEVCGVLANHGAGNQGESASLLYSQWKWTSGWGLPTDAWCHSSDCPDLNSPRGHGAYCLAQVFLDHCN